MLDFLPSIEEPPVFKTPEWLTQCMLLGSGQAAWGESAEE